MAAERRGPCGRPRPDERESTERWARPLRRVRAAGAEYYLWEAGGEAALEGPEDRPVAARLVCDWSTTEAEVDRFLALVAGDAAASGGA